MDQLLIRESIEKIKYINVCLSTYHLGFFYPLNSSCLSFIYSIARDYHAN